MHVSQPILPALVAKRQPLVVDAEEMQDRRLHVVDVDRVRVMFQPKSSVAPKVVPGLTPPPASHIEYARPK